jgi:hypothetical protein
VDVPKKVREDLKIVPLQHMDQVLEIAISPEPVMDPPRPRRRQEESGEQPE